MFQAFQNVQEHEFIIFELGDSWARSWTFILELQAIFVEKHIIQLELYENWPRSWDKNLTKPAESFCKCLYKNAMTS